MKNLKGQTDTLITGCVAMLIIGIVPLIGAIHFSSAGIGNHTGYITAVEQEGYIWQNYRVYMKTDLSSSQEDIYCMLESRIDLANELGKARESKSRVTVTYNGVRGFGWNLCRDFEITEVKLVDEEI